MKCEEWSWRIRRCGWLVGVSSEWVGIIYLVNLNNMEYTELSTLKGFLSITDDTQDDSLSSIISRMTKSLDNFFWWNLGTAEYVEYLDWPNKLFLRLRNIRAISLYDEDGNDMSGEVKMIRGRRVVLKSSISGEIKVEYTAWWDDLEEVWDIEWVFLNMCRDEYNNQWGEREERLKSESVDGIRLSYYSDVEVEDMAKAKYGRSSLDILKRYRAFTFWRAR